MKDDSLGDVYFDKQRYDAAIDSLNKATDKELWNSVGKQEKSEALKIDEDEMKSACENYGKQENVYAKQIWNEAIEAATKVGLQYSGIETAERIRKLKK